MENLEKLLSLIEKKHLNDIHQKLLHNLLENDTSLNDFYKTYQKLGRAFTTSKHLTADELADYILVKDKLEPSNILNLQNIFQLEEHLHHCSKCSNELEFYRNEYSEVKSFVTNQLDSPNLNPSNRHEFKKFSVGKNRFVKPFAYVLSSLAIIASALVLIINFTGPNNYKLASLDDEFNISTARGRTTDNFELSIMALEAEDYQKAIEYLSDDIKMNSEDETIFYSYYILGLTHLKTAQRDFLGLFPSFDKGSAKTAIINFTKAIENNTHGKFPNVNLDAYFYIAKASLMLEDSRTARKYLEKVVTEKGSKMNEAKQILNEL